MSSLSTISAGSSARPDFSQLQQNLFNNADTDGDGAISQDELQSLLDKSPRLAKGLAALAGSSAGSAPTAADIFKTLDTDGDGKVSEAEFKTGLGNAHKAAHAHGGGACEAAPSDLSSVLQKIFADGDSDGDGALSSDDLDAMMQKIPGLARDLKSLVGTTDGTTAGTDNIFSALDSDGDGKVSEPEFTSALTQAHEKIMAQASAAKPAAANGSGGAGGSDNSSDLRTLMLEIFEKLQQQQSAYAPDGTATTNSATAANTFNVVA